MYRFWKPIIEPIFSILKPRTVVEIGIDQGNNTRNLVQYCLKHDSTLHAIDPFLKLNVEKWKKEYGDALVFHRGLSLNELSHIDHIDAVLIDGDHNWYTVFHELKLIEKGATRNRHSFPLVLLHDIGWPYGRRDLYYNPDNIPEAYRKPYKKLGIKPGNAELAEQGGLNPHLYNAIYENDFQNGVLTAVEDFLEDAKIDFELIKIPAISGLGILFPNDLKANNPDFRIFLEALATPPVINDLIVQIENSRIDSEVARHEIKKLKDLEVDQLGKQAVKLEQSQRIAEKELIQFRSDIEASSKTLIEKDREIAELTNRLAESDQVKDMLRDEIEGLKSSVQTSKETLLEKDRTIADLTYGLAAKDREKAEAQRKIEDFRLDINNKNEHLILKEKELERRSNEIQKLVRWLEMLEHDITALYSSWRWKTGNALVRGIEVALLKKRVPMAIDHIREIFSQIDEWKKTFLENRPRIQFPPGTQFPETDVPKVLKKRVSFSEQQNNLNLKTGVSIIILNRNGATHLRKLFVSFERVNTYKPIEFLVVDHGSDDESFEVLEDFRKTLFIRIFRFDKNYSFSYSNNFAAQKANYEYLFFLNNDIIFSEDIIGSLLTTFEVNDVGVVGLKLFYPKNHNHYPAQVQHCGIRFSEDLPHEFYRPINLLSGFSLNTCTKFPAVTAAAMICRKSEFSSIGGFCEDYFYGYEDVDLCLSFIKRLNKYSVVINNISAIHDESSTQKGISDAEKSKWRLNNISILKERHGYGLRKAIQSDRLKAESFWTDDPFIVAFAVTEASEDAKAGDYFTASELANALKLKFFYEIKFLSMRDSEKDSYDLTGVDALIVMIDKYDLLKIHGAKPSLIKIAWMRNWFDRWAQRPWFDEYDIFLASSEKAAEFIKNDYAKSCHVFRIACNEKRFTPDTPSRRDFLSDYCFTGNYWDAPRDIEKLSPEMMGYKFAVYGSGWDKNAKFKPYCKGFVPYKELPSVYSSAKVVLDDANHVTKPWGSVNSRVFDSLAAGALAISNGIEGAKEVFEGRLPTYETTHDLKVLLDFYLNNEKERKTLVEDLRKTVIENHTYSHRARELNSILLNYREYKFRIAIKVPAPKMEVAHEWGDYHFALALKKAFGKLGHSVRIDLLPDWYTSSGFGDDIVLVLRGLSEYNPKREHINIMWNISHPDKIDYQEYGKYDHIFAASLKYAEKLKKEIEIPVTPLLQCTDPDLFYRDPDDNFPKHDILFVGNSRKQYRKIVKDAISANIPVAVYGSLWEGIIPEKYLYGDHVKNTELRKYYSNSKLVLNDHWPSMKQNGFISNRIFDAGACGALIISDKITGLESVFGDAVLTYETPDDLKSILSSQDMNNFDNPSRLAIRKMVTENHTFDHRVRHITSTLREIDMLKRLESNPFFAQNTGTA